MPRLTERFSNGQAAVAGCGNNCKYDYKYCKDNYQENCPTLCEIYDKLAFYEDLEGKGELPIMYGVNDFFDKSFNKKYNVEWYSGDGKVQTTSAVLTDVKDGYIHFIYPNGGLFIIEQKVLRSMQCIDY